jgi:diadenosine tetraphosphate (Ap4A) HIT family hydrolase
VSACRICELNEETETLPLREKLYLDRHWRVSHGWSSLPGWLVVAARRHVESLAELTPDEAVGLGRILHAASVALEQVVACAKTYVILFAEHPRYPHVHLHVVPRMEWFGERDRSTEVFRFLSVAEDEQVSVEERERLAAALGVRMQEVLS